MTQITFPQVGQLTALSFLSLYIHTPWCIKECPYCDFNSHSLKNELPEVAYIDTFLTDLQLELPNIWGRPVEMIFFGGGTSSLSQAESIDRLLSGVRSLLRLQPEAEITLKANPGTFEIEKFQGFRDADIMRLSIDVQSPNDGMLARLGRVHNGKEASTAVATALKLFDKVNIDLVYALSNQAAQTALDDVQTAIATGATHISAYHLTVESNTSFGHTPPKCLPQDEAAFDIEDAAHGALEGVGFIYYGTSALMKPAMQCRHSSSYWQSGGYLGIGAGAYGRTSYSDRTKRTVRRRHPNDYLALMQSQPSEAVERKTVTTEDLPLEFMMNALRPTDGVSAAMLQEHTGVPAAKIMAQVEMVRQKGLLRTNPTVSRSTERGRLFLNDSLQCSLQPLILSDGFDAPNRNIFGLPLYQAV